MKYFLFLFLTISGFLFAQQKPFAFYHSAWSGTSQLPANFIATGSQVDDNLTIDATVFYRSPVDFDSILVIAKVGSAPLNRFDGIEVYYGIDTAGVQGLEFPHASFVDQSTVYAAIYLRSTDGKWSGAKTDTAFFGIQTQLTTPTLILNSGSGSIIVDADDLDGNATHILIQQRSFQNHTSIHSYGSRFKDSLVAVGNLPLTFTGRYYDEVWHFKIAAVNGADTSDFTAVDSSWAVNTVGDTIWYAASATGNGSGSDSTNAKVYSVTNIQNDIYANVPGRHIKLKNVDTFASSSRILLPTTQSWSGRSYAPIVIEPWYDNSTLPVIDRTVSGEVIYVERGNHITFRKIHFAGEVFFNVPATYHADNFRFVDCQFIGTGSGADGSIPMFLSETNVVAYDSVNRGYADSFYVYNCLFQNIYSNNDAIGSSSGGVDWVIYRNVVANTGTARGQDGIDVGHGYRVIIAYNQIYNTWNNGIKIMAQRGPNHNALVCYNEVIGNNMSGDGNFAFDIRTCVDIRFFSNSGTGFGYGLPAETSWPDNTHNGDLNDNSTYPVIAFQGLGNNIFNNLYVGGSGNGFSGWIIHGGKNIMFTYPGGDTTRATWGPGRDDWGRWYLNYSSWHHNLYNNPQGGDKARYVARHWPVTGNGSITWNGSDYDLSIGTQAWNERDMEEFGTGYTDKFFNNIFLPAQVVDSAYTNDGDRGSLQLVEGSPALYSGTFNGMAVDLNWQPVPDTLVSIGAYQNPYVSVTDHFTYNFTWENQDFLVQRNGIKNLSIDVSSGVTEYDSVVMNIYKNNSLFLTDNNALNYSGGLATTTLTINVPADTCNYAGTFRRDGVTLDSATFWVGDVYLVSGQSNAIQDVSGYQDSLNAMNFKSKWFKTSRFGSWIDAETTVMEYMGTSCTILADSTIRKKGRPIAIFNGAVGGTSIKDHLPGQTYFNQLKDAVRAVRQHVNGFTKAYWWQGETEADTVFITYPMYFASLNQGLKDSMNVDTTIIVQLGMHNCLYMEGKTFQLQRRIANAYSDVGIIGISHFNKFVDDCHFTFQEYKNIGTWIYRLNNSSGYANPIITDAQYDPVTGILDLTFDQDVIYPADSSGRSLDDFWIIDGDSLMVTAGESNANVASLTISGAPAEVNTVGLLRTYRWYSDNNYYRYPFLKNANGTGVILFDSVAVTTLDGIVMSNPSQFVATFGSNSSLRFQGTFDSDTDTVRINQKRVSSPVNAYSDSVLIVRLSSGVLDTTITGSWYNDTTYYFRCSTIGDSSGTSVTTFALDTAVVPAAGGGGGIAAVNFENNTETGTDGFTTVVKTPHTSGTQNTVVSNGTYAWEITGSGSSSNDVYGNLPYSDQGTVTLKFDMWLSYGWVGGDYTGTNIARIYGNGNELVNLSLQPASFSGGGFRFGVSGSSLDGETDLDSTVTGILFADIFEQWVTIEMQWVKSTTVGGCVLKIDGVTVYSELDKNTNAYTANEIRVGFWTNGDNLGAVASRFDNIIVE